MDAIYNIDLDFFTRPYYHGNCFIEDEFGSSSDFFASSSMWLTVETFAQVTGLSPMRGCKVRDDSQPFFYWQRMVAENYLRRKQFTIVNFDSHHDMYVKFDEEFYLSLSNQFHPFDNMIAPFVHGLVDEVVWVVPDYYDGDTFRHHFKGMAVSMGRDNVARVQISQDFFATVRIVKWREFDRTKYTPKYLSMILNPSMARVDNATVAALSKYILPY